MQMVANVQHAMANLPTLADLEAEDQRARSEATSWEREQKGEYSSYEPEPSTFGGGGSGSSQAVG